MRIRDWYSILRAYAIREEGQTMAEYGVVLAVITLGVVIALTALAAAVTNKLGAATALSVGARDRKTWALRPFGCRAHEIPDTR